MKTKSYDIEMHAHSAWEKGRNKLAFELFKAGASQGLVGCMHDLAYFYDEGIGVKKNKTQSMFWYKKAYRKQYSPSASNIAILYKEQNKNRLAFQWFCRAARLGDGDANVDIAKSYISGIGVRSSSHLAKRYLRAALKSKHITEAGREEAEMLLSEVNNGL